MSPKKGEVHFDTPPYYIHKNDNLFLEFHICRQISSHFARSRKTGSKVSND